VTCPYAAMHFLAAVADDPAPRTLPNAQNRIRELRKREGVGRQQALIEAPGTARTRFTQI
jgi:hypothetical protein